MYSFLFIFISGGFDMVFRMENKNEYKALKSLVSFYELLSFISSRENEKISLQQKMMILQNYLAIETQKMQELISVKSGIKNSILVGLYVSLQKSCAIQKYFNEPNVDLDRVYKEVQSFCEGYQEFYKGWKIALDDYKMTLGFRMKKWIPSKWLERADRESDRIAKIFTNSKIDTMDEFLNIDVCVESYLLFLEYIEKDNRDQFFNAMEIIEKANAIQELFNNHFIPAAGEGITNKWAQECISFILRVRKRMEQFILYGEESIYLNSIKDMRIFCNTHQMEFNQWKIDYAKYLLGMEKLDKALTIALGILLGLLITLVSLIDFEKDQNLKKEKIEFFEEVDFDAITSLQEVTVEQILKRRF